MKNCSLEKNKNEDIITNSRSRILVVTNMYPSSKHPHYGIFVKNSVEILKDEGFSISLVCKKKEEFILNKILSYIVFYVKSIHMGLFGKYDVIYVHYVSHCALPVLIVKFFRKGIHIVANVHGNDIVPETEKDKKYIRLSKKLLDSSITIISPSKYFKRVLVEQFDISDDKINIYPSGGVNTDVFKKIDLRETRKLLNIKKENIYISFVGRFEENKGWDTFLLGTKDIIKKNPKIRLLVVGEGSQKEDFLRLAEDLGVRGRMDIFPMMTQKELSLIYNASDIFVFPTKRKSESLGLVGLEAMACESIVVASDKYGPSSYLINGYNGYSFRAGDSEDLQNSIIKVFRQDNEILKNVRVNARKTAQKFSLGSNRDNLCSVFRKLSEL